jgi:hypothetical protein
MWAIAGWPHLAHTEKWRFAPYCDISSTYDAGERNVNPGLASLLLDAPAVDEKIDLRCALLAEGKHGRGAVVREKAADRKHFWRLEPPTPALPWRWSVLS